MPQGYFILKEGTIFADITVDSQIQLIFSYGWHGDAYSLLQIEKDGGDIAGFVGCQVEVRSLGGSVKFAGEMINYDSKNGIVTVATEQGNRDAILCEAFVID